jgi:hypothetical protein
LLNLEDEEEKECASVILQRLFLPASNTSTFEIQSKIVLVLLLEGGGGIRTRRKEVPNERP